MRSSQFFHHPPRGHDEPTFDDDRGCGHPEDEATIGRDHWRKYRARDPRGVDGGRCACRTDGRGANRDSPCRLWSGRVERWRYHHARNAIGSAQVGAGQNRDSYCSRTIRCLVAVVLRESGRRSFDGSRDRERMRCPPRRPERRRSRFGSRGLFSPARLCLDGCSDAAEGRWRCDHTSSGRRGFCTPSGEDDLGASGLSGARGKKRGRGGAHLAVA